MFENKRRLIENLTGVNSSKLNYYLELKERNQVIVQQNKRLEIINQLAKDINIDMSFDDILERVYQKLPSVIRCDFLAIALLEQEKLIMSAAAPKNDYIGKAIPPGSVLWEAIESGKNKVYDLTNSYEHTAQWDYVGDWDLSSMAVNPLFVHGKVIGILIIGSCTEYAYSKSELNFSGHLADQLAVCIANSLLYKQVLRGKREWEETFGAVTEPIFIIDLNFNILRGNTDFFNFVNNPEEIIGQKCYKLLWDKEEKCEDCLLEQVVSTGQAAYYQKQLDSGAILDVFCYPILNERNELYAIIQHIKDVTEKEKMKAQLVQSAKLAAIGEMAAGVAHEINNPMTVIIGNAQLLLRDLGEQDEAAKEVLHDIVNCGLRCKKIIQNLLAFSRQDQYPFSSIDINEVAERALSLTRYQINSNNINIEVEKEPTIPPVIANMHQLEQVIINFLLNARDALESNGEKEKIIKIFTGIRSDVQGKRWVLISVLDNGPGIPPDIIPKIFNPFFTSKETTKGTGLGLSVSLGIAQAHKGTIEVDSEVGRGSKFTLVLPLDNS
ncbi:GAF domain-containing sensor histidine kinase [Desulfolucanica intricata]|uniref:GAF domain-containing sensor histidine kinase n=1 Tax=Desulfolucanica intricata TaxID=1285191 RepID=UPI000835B3CA|nr:ATP-binding protein [Desulfolucanica intricata]